MYARYDRQRGRYSSNRPVRSVRVLGGEQVKRTLTALGFVAVIVTLGFAGAEEQQTRLAETMIEHCEATEPDCFQLIGEVEKGGKFEVLSDNNNRFWVEERGNCNKDCGEED